METTADVRREIDVTRERMAATVGELEARIQGKVDAVKQKLDVMDMARAHPWPALLVATVAGVAFAAGPDRKAAVATVRAAKSSPRIVGKGLKATASGASHLAVAAVSRLKGSDDEGSEGPGEPGFFGRTKAKLTEIARREAHVLGQHLGRAADELVGAAVPRRSALGTSPGTGSGAATGSMSATSGTMGALTPDDRF